MIRTRTRSPRFTRSGSVAGYALPLIVMRSYAGSSAPRIMPPIPRPPIIPRIIPPMSPPIMPPMLPAAARNPASVSGTGVPVPVAQSSRTNVTSRS